MVLTCSVCKNRARNDGSCRTSACRMYRPASLRGSHWQLKRLRACGPGLRASIVEGASSLLLRQRHDMRIAIAAGQYLRQVGLLEVARRVEVLAVLFLVYWKWPTASLLRNLLHPQPLARNSQPLARSFVLCDDPQSRADLFTMAWRAMESEMSGAQVASFPHDLRVALLTEEESFDLFDEATPPATREERVRHTQLQRVFAAERRTPRGKSCFVYHPYKSSSHDFYSLVADIRKGTLIKASASLGAALLSPKCSYCDLREKQKGYAITLWDKPAFDHQRWLQWLSLAEGGKDLRIAEPDWSQMQADCPVVRKSLVEAGFDTSFPAAVAATGAISQELGFGYTLHDFFHNHRMLAHPECQGRENDLRSVSLPAPVCLQADLGLSGLGRRRVSSKAGSSRAVAVLASVLWELGHWTGNGAFVSLDLCCRAFNANGFLTTLRQASQKRKVADTVAAQLSLQWPALRQRGVCESKRLRIQACALDWLDNIASCRRVIMRSDQQPLAWALIRLGVKFELMPSISEKCWTLFGGTGNDAVCQLECRVMMSVPRGLGEFGDVVT